MGVITQSVMVQANIDVNRLNPAQKVSLVDQIFDQQSNMLTSIIALPRIGVGMMQLEVPLHILLVTFQADGHGSRWDRWTLTIGQRVAQLGDEALLAS